jgi:hypothetical protein
MCTFLVVKFGRGFSLRKFKRKSSRSFYACVTEFVEITFLRSCKLEAQNVPGKGNIFCISHVNVGKVTCNWHKNQLKTNCKSVRWHGTDYLVASVNTTRILMIHPHVVNDVISNMGTNLWECNFAQCLQQRLPNYRIAWRTISAFRPAWPSNQHIRHNTSVKLPNPGSKFSQPAL